MKETDKIKNIRKALSLDQVAFAIVTKYNQSLIKIIRKGSNNDNLILRSNNKDIDIHKKVLV